MCSFSNCQRQLGEAWAEEESADSKQVSHISGWDSMTLAVTAVDSLPGFSLAASQSLGPEPALKAKLQHSMTVSSQSAGTSVPS